MHIEQWKYGKKYSSSRIYRTRYQMTVIYYYLERESIEISNK